MPVFAAGLALAAFTLLVLQVPYGLLVGGSAPNAVAWVTVSAVVILLVTLTAGAVLAWLGHRISREWDDRKATTLFFVLGFLGVGIWSFMVLGSLLGAATGDPTTATSGIALASVLYLAVAGGLSAAVGRYFARDAADRPLLVVILGVSVALCAVLGGMALGSA
ncbi:hypothetical protein [Oerskovia gallyi]|uniref:Major facilitator superfamily (MFS) profile domain-containing protein n=1 Tax=Oerskovia gallyi TaxID=2762226 RepID=A0ABR8V3C7_9CELL|nr:hypothetical protein [Oerskovia gallyi]MBD7999296.1 hypothetical protein [Oerskovia gallyi]